MAGQVVRPGTSAEALTKAGVGNVWTSGSGTVSVKKTKNSTGVVQYMMVSPTIGTQFTTDQAEAANFMTRNNVNQNNTNPGLSVVPTKTPVAAVTSSTNKIPFVNASLPPANSSNEDVGKAPAQVDTREYQRWVNPLGWLSSYTYQISLYMTNTEGYSQFADNNYSLSGIIGKNIKLLVQSGGRKKSDQSGAFALDYEIDNLEIKSHGISSTDAATIDSKIKFVIKEPYGFSFTSELTRAAQELGVLLGAVSNGKETFSSGTATSGSIQDATRSNFILAVRFYGYDEAGNPVTGSTKFGDKVLDPASTGVALFEKYMAISIAEMKMAIDGRATSYQVTATPTILDGFKPAVSEIKNDLSLTGTTVNELLTDLCNKLTAESEKNAQDKTKFNSFKIRYASDETSTQIGQAKVVVPTDVDKSKMPGSKVENTAQSNDATMVATRKLDTNARTITINRGETLLKAIEQIIGDSEYIHNAFKKNHTTALETNKTGFDVKEQDTGQKTRFFTVTPEITNLRVDQTTNTKVADYTYVIEIFETPGITVPNSNGSVDMYEPVKVYDYWYTGKNTEITRFTLNLDNNFYMQMIGNSPDIPVDDNTPKAVGLKSPGSRNNKPGLSPENKNAYTTYIYDPSGMARVNMDILGDPDYISPPRPSDTAGTDYAKFYRKEDNSTLSYTAGFLHFQINFKETRDYDISTGTMPINTDIVLVGKENTKSPEVMTFLLQEVTSNFKAGKFTQRIEGVWNIGATDNIGNLSDQGRENTDQKDPSSSGLTKDSPDSPVQGLTTGVAAEKLAGAAVPQAHEP